jgi:hypothetical protein
MKRNASAKKTFVEENTMSDFKKIAQTALFSLVFFLILLIFSTNIFFTNQAGFKIESTHVFIALAPLAIWLIVSGKLDEIRGPGGIGLLIRDEVQKPIPAELVDKPLDVVPDYVREKEDTERLSRQVNQDLAAGKPPAALSFRVGKKGYYGEGAIESSISTMERSPKFQFIIFNDEKGKFKGFMKVDDFERLMGSDIVDMIESSQILENPKVIKDYIKKTSTNRKALDEMEKANTNMLGIVDEDYKLIQIITRDEILRKILTRAILEA